MGGCMGLDYPAVEAVMRIQGVSKKERRALFADLRVMESAAMSVFNEAKRK